MPVNRRGINDAIIVFLGRRNPHFICTSVVRCILISNYNVKNGHFRICGILPLPSLVCGGPSFFFFARWHSVLLPHHLLLRDHNTDMAVDWMHLVHLAGRRRARIQKSLTDPRRPEAAWAGREAGGLGSLTQSFPQQ